MLDSSKLFSLNLLKIDIFYVNLQVGLHMVSTDVEEELG